MWSDQREMWAQWVEDGGVVLRRELVELPSSSSRKCFWLEHREYRQKTHFFVRSGSLEEDQKLTQVPSFLSSRQSFSSSICSPTINKRVSDFLELELGFVEERDVIR